MKISIITPIYNEIESIDECKDLIKDLMLKKNLDYEHIFVDNSSNDGSSEKLKKICENDEIIENICILLSIHTTDMFAKCSDIEITKIDLSQPISIQKFIVDLHQAKPKQYNGVSTKSLFKLMEMIELIHKK